MNAGRAAHATKLSVGSVALWAIAAAVPTMSRVSIGTAGPRRATATVLFTDVVGSTAVRAQLGEQVAEELRRQHDRLLSEAIEVNSGRVIKGLGDGVMATFTGASDALAAAVAIQRALDRRNRLANAPSRLEVRIGLSAGDVTFEDEDCHGTPVVEAARLCAAARGGQILASEMVRWLARGGGHRFTPYAALDLKGLPEPVPAVEVGWSPEAGLALPLPAALGRPETFRFVGREGEREALLRAWKEAAAGERRVVLVAGEPGIGKTSVAAELARGVHADGALVLYGRCDEELGIPYQPFAEALGAYVAACPAEELRAQLGRLGGELARLVPDLPKRVPGLPEPLRAEPETERYRLLDGVRQFLTAMSDFAPVLLVLDDLHWAVKPTLTLLRHIVRVGESTRLLVVGTYRDTDVARTHPLAEVLAELRGEPGVERLSLRGFDESEVVAYIEAAAGHALDAEDMAFARTVHAESEGNPFFVGEILRHLAEIGGVAQQAGRWRATRSFAEFGLPEGVRELIGQRLARLPETANEVLGVAATIGREFDVALLTEVSERDQDAVLDALEQAERSRLVVGVPGRHDRFSYAHALVRATVLDGLPASRRLRLHRRVGCALEARPDAGARIAELAHHFGEAAALGEVERAVHYSRRAGDLARASLAFEEAGLHYERALAALAVAGRAEPALRCDLEIALGDALHRAGDPRHRDVLAGAADRARTLGDPMRLAEVVLALNLMGYWSTVGGVDPGFVTLAEEALAAIGDADTPVRARVLAVLAAELSFTAEEERRLALGREAIAVARRLGDPATLARVQASYLLASRRPDGLEERLGLAGELISLGEELGDLEATFYGHTLRWWELFDRGDIAAAEAHLETIDDLARVLHQPLALWRSDARRGCHALLAGRLGDAEQLALDTYQTAIRGGAPEAVAKAGYVIQLFALRYDQGRSAEIEPAVAALVDAQPVYLVWRAWLALLQSGSDDPARARSQLEALSTRNFSNFPRETGWLSGMVALAQVAAALGDRSRAGVLYHLLSPYPGRNSNMGAAPTGPTDLALGMLAGTLGRFEDAEGHFVACDAFCQRMGAPTWLARTRAEWARVLTARASRGDAERARRLAGEALAMAEGLGMTGVAGQARSVLARSPLERESPT